MTVSANAIAPNTSVAQCTAQATAAADPQPNGSLGFDTVTLAMGPPEAARVIEAQTRGVDEALNDFDYYLQVTCPNV